MIENIKEVILCKYGEVVLKGANRGDFEKKMLKELRIRVVKPRLDYINFMHATYLLLYKDVSIGVSPRRYFYA